MRTLAPQLLPGGALQVTEWDAPGPWRCLFVAERALRSQFDVLVDWSRRAPCEEGVLCLAREGHRFHGQRGRPWAAVDGNLHLSAYWSPRRPIERAHVALTVLAAVSAVDAIDAVPGLEGRAAIKWVNDIVIDEAKVCGVIAHAHSEGGVLTGVILGIGLNVEATPRVAPTPFVPRVARLADFAPCTQGDVFLRLLSALDRNERVLAGGGYAALLERYRRRSVILGRKVVICRETNEVTARGRVTSIGEDLELYLDGSGRPVHTGRLALDPAREEIVHGIG